MASIVKRPNGNWWIQYVDADKSRKTLRLGKTSKRNAEAVKLRVELLLAAKITGHAIDSDTAAWLARLDNAMLEKLEAVKLIEPLRREATKLEPFLESYMASRGDLKASTRVAMRHTVRNLIDFYGPNKDLRAIDPAAADNFRGWLLEQKLAPATASKRLQVARQFFAVMRRRKLIDENPFDGVSLPATGVRDKQRFIPRADVERILEACPNVDWRLIVALARYGGLRCPSEVLSLRWQDVLWDTGRLIVTSPKTEHHEGRESRTIPLFPELRPILEEAFEAAPEGAVYVVDERFRQAALGKGGWINCNLRTQFERIIKRAGLMPWPRLFQNLRSSRETELMERFPIHTVTAWLGNTPAVAMRHYLQVRDEDFAKAAQGEAHPKQNAKQSPQVSGGTDSHEECENPRKHAKNAVTPGVSESGEWAHQDSNLGPQPYQGCALTN